MNLLSGYPGLDAQAELQEVVRAGTAIKGALDQLARTIQTPRGRALLEQVNVARSVYQVRQADVLKLIREGRTEEARSLWYTRVRPLRDVYSASVRALADYQGGW